MKKVVKQRINTYNPLRRKSAKRKYHLKCNDSNIFLNIISVSVIPQNAVWSDIEVFTNKKYGPFQFDFRNSKGDIIAELKYNVTYNCRGSYNGAGQYLTEVTISPCSIFAKAGYYLTCNVTAGNPINFGTKADPIAGIVLKVQMQVKGYLIEEQYLNVLVRGDCQVSILCGSGY